jgi:hypothetical protein
VALLQADPRIMSSLNTRHILGNIADMIAQRISINLNFLPARPQTLATALVPNVNVSPSHDAIDLTNFNLPASQVDHYYLLH